MSFCVFFLIAFNSSFSIVFELYSFLQDFHLFLFRFNIFFPGAEFGSALNIETLVAAAERRETPIEVFYISLY